MPVLVDKRELIARLGPLLSGHGLARVTPDATEFVANAASLALAGLPHYEEIWAGDMGSIVSVVAVASGERIAGVDLVRRKDLLAERLAGIEDRVRIPAQALQLVVYERPIPQQERDYVLREARKGGLLPLGRARVATWMIALDQIALHTTRFPGWPEALGAEELRKLLVSPSA